MAAGADGGGGGDRMSKRATRRQRRQQQSHPVDDWHERASAEMVRRASEPPSWSVAMEKELATLRDDVKRKESE